MLHTAFSNWIDLIVSIIRLLWNSNLLFCFNNKMFCMNARCVLYLGCLLFVIRFLGRQKKEHQKMKKKEKSNEI